MNPKGVALFIMSAICAILYTWLMFFTPWKDVVVQISAYIAIMIVLAVVMLLGYLLATTPEVKAVSTEERVRKMLEERGRENREAL